MKRSLLHGVLIAMALALVGFLLLQQSAPAVTSAQEGDQEPGRSSAAPAGVPAAQLSPPDSPEAHSGPETPELEPQAPEGVVLRDFRLPGSALRPRASGIGYNWGAGGGCIYNSSGDPTAIFNVPLTLPEGATINTVRMYYDDESDLNSTGYFSIYDLYGHLVTEWQMNSSGVGGNGFADTVVVDHTIDYGVYSYALNWRPTEQGPDMQLCGFRIYYEAPPFGLSFLPWVAGD